MATLKETEIYHKRKGAIPRVIYSTINKGEIVYGERALNARFPKYLDRPTTDYDIFSRKPKESAVETERRLDRKIGFNAFEVKPAEHKGTYKVKSKVTGEGVADYTRPQEKIPYVVIRGKRYISLNKAKQFYHRSLRDPEFSFRHPKDRDSLNRIKVYERLNKSNKPTTTRRTVKRLSYHKPMQSFNLFSTSSSLRRRR